MKRGWKAAVAVGIGVLFLGGCATSLELPDPPNGPLCRGLGFTKDGVDIDAIAKVLVDLMKADAKVDAATDSAAEQNLRNARDERWKKLDDVLYCLIGPIPGHPDDPEARLFRGHVIVTLLARYGAFNVTGQVGPIWNVEFRPYPELTEDAATLLRHIEVAEAMLRAESALLNAGKPAQGTMYDAVPHVKRLHRMIPIFQVGLDAETPTYRRTSRAFRSFVTTMATQSWGNLKDLATDALTGVKKASVLGIAGPAYMGDARIYLENLRDKQVPPAVTPSPVIKNDWALWDRLLVEACDRLASSGGAPVHHCIPDDDIQEARKYLYNLR